MKAKYCPCLGVKFGAVGRRDIAEDFGLMGLEPAGTMKVYYALKRSEVECVPNCRLGAVPSGLQVKLPPFWPAVLVRPPKRWV
jgi:hypothetical protein